MHKDQNKEATNNPFCPFSCKGHTLQSVPLLFQNPEIDAILSRAHPPCSKLFLNSTLYDDSFSISLFPTKNRHQGGLEI